MDEGADKQLLDDWMTAVAQGDKEAFARLYERMKPSVYGLALSIVRERGDAEDVMQNTFIRIWDCAGQYRRGTDPRAWVLKIARNLSLMLLRSRKRTTPVGEWTEQAAGEDETEVLLDRVLLQTLLTSLDENERQVVMLYAVEGYSHKEIAGILEKPYATVRWKYSNAMKKLSKRMDVSAGTRADGGETQAGLSRVKRFAGL